MEHGAHLDDHKVEPTPDPVVQGRTYTVNPHITIAALDTGDVEEMYQVNTGEKRYQVSGKAIRLISHVQSGKTADQIFASLLVEFPSLTRCAFDEALTQLASRRDLVTVSSGSNEASWPTSKRGNGRVLGRGGKHGFTLRLRLVTPEVIRPITSRLRQLFLPGIAWPLGVAIVFCNLVFLVHLHYAGRPLGQPIRGVAWIVLAASVYAGVFFHELGHASACTYFNVDHGDIGLGVYVIYPVFYSDVTESWLLSRRARMVVDAGGLYFQSIFSATTGMIWYFTGDIVCFYITTSLLATAIVNVNPFLRFDGYWLLSDYLGHPRLDRVAREYAKYVVSRLWRRRALPPKPEIFEHNSRLCAAIVTYSVMYVAFMVYFGYRLISFGVPLLLRQCTRSLAQIYKALFISHGGGLTPHLLVQSLALSFILLGFTKVLIQQVRKLLKHKWLSGR